MPGDPFLWSTQPTRRRKVPSVICSEAIAVNRGGFDKQAAILKCKRWSCEICRPMCAWRVVKAACRGNPNKLITFTCKPDQYETPDEAARAMKNALVALRKALAREKGIAKLPMIIVFEAHKSGWPHMHILARGPWISQVWLSDTWKRLTGAWCVDIRKIQDGGRAAKYVAKYLGKDLHSFKGCKRWWRTHDYEKNEEKEDGKFAFGSRWDREATTWPAFLRWIAQADLVEIVELKPSWCHWRDWSV